MIKLSQPIKIMYYDHTTQKLEMELDFAKVSRAECDLALKLKTILISCQEKWENKKMTNRFFSYVKETFGISLSFGKNYVFREMRLEASFVENGRRISASIYLKTDENSKVLTSNLLTLQEEIARGEIRIKEIDKKIELMEGNFNKIHEDMSLVSKEVASRIQKSVFFSLYKDSSELRNYLLNEVSHLLFQQTENK